MLRIRLQRTGRKNRAEYRVVVAEKHLAVKKAAQEILGHYLPTREPKVIEIDLDRVKYWIERGAQPTDTVASLCKQLGMDDMDKYMDPRDKKRKPKKEPEESAAPAATPEAAPKAEPAPEEGEAKEEQPEEPAPEAEEAPAE